MSNEAIRQFTEKLIKEGRIDIEATQRLIKTLEKSLEKVVNNMDCPYKYECTDKGMLCNSCRHNTGKKSHYEPEPIPYIPYPYPCTPIPYPNPYDPIWISDDHTDGSKKIDYYIVCCVK